MSISKWLVFNSEGEKVKTETIKHKSNLAYIELEQFETELKEKGLYAHRKESFNTQPKNISLKQKLINLGWTFGGNGKIVSAR